ncbi:MAG: PEGA domain-containing protein [Polyangiales bacterium]
MPRFVVPEGVLPRFRALAPLVGLALVAVTATVLAKPPVVKPPAPKPATSAKTSASASASAVPTTPPPAPLTADELEGKRHFEIGLKLYGEKVYESALIEFETSYKLSPRASALRNVAQCHRDLTHFAQAHETYARLLAAHGAQLAPKENAAIVKAMKDLEVVTGTVELTVNEPGASVQFDARAIGVTPLDKPFRADVGTHKLRVLKSGFEPIEKDVSTLAQQTQVVSLTLVKENKTGHLTVREESGKEVHVFVDDVDVGPAPWSGDLAPGSHVIEVKGEGIGAPKRTIELAAKGNLEVAIDATPLMGHLRVQTLNKLGEIFVDGKKVNEKPGEWEGDLAPGTYEVSVVAAGYEPYKHLVGVTKGQTVLEAVTLVAKPLPPPPLPPKENPYKGLYAKFNFIGAFPLSGGADLQNNCNGGTGGTCSNGGFDAAVGPKLHVGYSWDFFSAEIVGAFMVDLPHHVDRSYKGNGATVVDKQLIGPTDDVARVETHKFQGFSSFFGPGARVTSKDDAVRFTFGLALGGVYRSLNYQRESLSDTWSPSKATTFAPGMMLDAGLLLGSTPGTKFTLGIMAWFEFTGRVDSEDGGQRSAKTGGTPSADVRLLSPPTSISTGMRFFLGPTIGLQFGR